MLLVLQK